MSDDSRMTDPRSLAAWRLAAASVSLVAVAAVIGALVVIAMAKYHTGARFGVEDVLITPFVSLFYVAPGFFITGMASRSRNMPAVGFALMLGLLLIGLLEAIGATPWHYGHWGKNHSDSGMMLTIATVLAWISTAVGALVWLALNRRDVK
jgi:hypothetical protein